MYQILKSPTNLDFMKMHNHIPKIRGKWNYIHVY